MNRKELYTYVCDTPKYSRKGKPERWVKVGEAEQKMFRSYPFFKEIPSEDNPNPKRFGDLVFDIDTGDTACRDAIKIIDYFESVFGVEYQQWRIYLSGKKGVHLELPDTVCGMGGGAVWLPLAYKTLAKQIEGDLGIVLDISMYNTGTGKPYRQPNIMRDCGTCKRQIEADQLYDIVDDDDYRAACSEPGPTWEPEGAAINKTLADKLSFYLQEAEKHQKILAETPQLSEREAEQLRKNEPPCVSFLRRASAMPRSGATYNNVAMQLTGYAVSCGIGEQQFISSCSEFIYRYPSTSLTTPEKRLSNCRDRYRCMSANSNGFTCGGVLSLGFSSWDFDCSKCAFKLEKERDDSFRFVPAEELLANIRPTDWLIKDVAVAESLAVLYGKSGTYKTFIAMHMLLCIASGIPFFGKKVRQGATAIIIGEGQNNFAKRLLAWKRYYELETVDHFYISTVPAQLTVEQSAIEVRKAIDELPEPVLAVGIDTLNRNFGPGNENSTEDMTAFVHNLDRYVGRDIMRLIVHHTGHTDGRARGSSVLRAALDTEYEVLRDSDTVSLSCTKQKDDVEFEPFKMRPHSVNIGVEGDLLADTSIVMEEADEDGTAKKPPKDRLLGWICVEKHPTREFAVENFELFGYTSVGSLRSSLSKMQKSGQISEVDGELKIA